MNTEKDSMKGGLFVLFALVALLAAPVVTGHFVLKGEAAPMIQANAANAQ